MIKTNLPKAKFEARCRDCHWAYFSRDHERVKNVFLYHYAEVCTVHCAFCIDPIASPSAPSAPSYKICRIAGLTTVFSGVLRCFAGVLRFQI